MFNNNPTFGQTSLSAGDIAFFAYSADTPDEFGFVLLKDIDASNLKEYSTAQREIRDIEEKSKNY